MEKVLEKIKKNGHSFQGLLPQCKMKSDGSFVLNHGGNWTDGFYIGVLNLAYLLSGDEEFRAMAKGYDDFFSLRIQNTQKINAENKFLPLDHDVGMIFLPSIGFAHTVDPQEKTLDILRRAADVLVDRFHEKGGFIRAWDTWDWDKDPEFIEEKKGKAIIDSMLNIPLLFQVSKHTGDQKYYEVGLRHAHTMADNIVRADGSTYHSYNFDPVTGAPRRGATVQGYSDESCWSRGQAWAAYGFALAYKYTGCRKFLETAEKTAKYFMEHLGCVDMPCWDFAAADQAFAPWDSSAGLICASGLLELHELTGKKEHLDSALRLLKAVERFCLTTDYENCQPLILHGCVGTAYSAENPSELKVRVIDQALVYADYFYLECKLKLSRCKVRIF